MCQVTPFTLPCCRRVYVEVLKLPSCPDAWPTSKCPSELCLQVHGFEPEDRPFGICWRCQAAQLNMTGKERELMRPMIDNANIVIGLEELDVQERKKTVEDQGKCWFCTATRGCGECGSEAVTAEDIKDIKGKGPAISMTVAATGSASTASKKRVRPESSAQTPKKRTRKILAGPSRYKEQVTPTASGSALGSTSGLGLVSEYPDPLLVSQLQGLPYPTAQPFGYSNSFLPMETQQGGYPAFQFGAFTQGNMPNFQSTPFPMTGVWQPGTEFQNSGFAYQQGFPNGINFGRNQMPNQVQIPGQNHMGQDQGQRVGVGSSQNTAIYSQSSDHNSPPGGGNRNTQRGISAMFRKIDSDILSNNTMGVLNSGQQPLEAQAAGDTLNGHESPHEEHSTPP